MSLSITGRDLVTRALQTLGVYAPGDVVSGTDIQVGFELLNELVDAWAIQALTILLVDRTAYDLVAGQGGPNNPYAYGPGGDFDTGTAARPPSIQDATLLLNGFTPPIEIPLAIITDDMYAAQAIKTQQSEYPQWVYYNPSVPLGQVFLWNVPSTSVNDLVLYTPTVTAAFPDLSTLYVCPPGYQKAFRLCLAEACVNAFAVPPQIAGKVTFDAAQALSDLKCSNVKMGDLSMDPGFVQHQHGTYVIQTDQGA